MIVEEPIGLKRRPDFLRVAQACEDGDRRIKSELMHDYALPF